MCSLSSPRLGQLLGGDEQRGQFPPQPWGAALLGGLCPDRGLSLTLTGPQGHTAQLDLYLLALTHGAGCSLGAAMDVPFPRSRFRSSFSTKNVSEKSCPFKEALVRPKGSHSGAMQGIRAPFEISPSTVLAETSEGPGEDGNPSHPVLSPGDMILVFQSLSCILQQPCEEASSFPFTDEGAQRWLVTGTSSHSCEVGRVFL
jgi:hypothetical protein